MGHLLALAPCLLIQTTPYARLRDLLPVIPDVYFGMEGGLHVTRRELEDVVTASEAAEIWGLSRDSLQSMAVRGDFGEGVRKSGGTWLFVRSVLIERYGEPKPPTDTGAGLPVMELLSSYGLKRLDDVLARRDDFPPGGLWRQGRRWLTTWTAMDKVFGRRK